jgi:glycolate oxidase iron-sulfur subunit
MARQLRDRKWGNIEQSGADVLVLGNPGCHSWIGRGGGERGSKVRVLHTMEVLEMAFLGQGLS